MALTKKFLEGRDPKSGKRRDETPGRWPAGNRLFLKVIAPGKRYWTVRIKLKGRDTELSLGAYPEMTIAAASKERDKLLGEASSDKHPRGGWRTVRSPASSKTPTFGEQAERYIAAREGGWSARHAAQWRYGVRVYCESIIDVPIPDIDTDMVLGILGPVWSEKPETGRRLRERIEAVVSSGYVRLGLTDKANPARWKGWLDDSELPRLDRRKLVRHHPALAFKDIPAFMARLRTAESASARCLEFTILTAVRTSEARLVRWSELDLGARVWTIPAARTKKGRQHRVPLSSAVVELLERRVGDGANEYVFLAPRSKRPLSEGAMAQFFKRSGFGSATVHGFRAAFRSWCKNRGVPFDVAEECLAHVSGDRTVQAYDRDDQLELRARVMEEWGHFCAGSSLVVAALSAPTS
jgi:integrase